MEKESVIRECIGILRNPDYLSDEVVRIYFEGLRLEFDNGDDILLVAPSVSFVLGETDKEGAEMMMQKMGLSGKNIIIFPMNGDGGSHWSTLVYFRSMNMFVHHDSMRGQNSDCATRLYELGSAFLSSHISSTKPPSSSSSKKSRRPATKDKNSSKNKKNPPRHHQSCDLPAFMECEMMPQQENGFDCGLYVLAIARAVCMWWSAGGRSCRENAVLNWFDTMKQHVNSQYVECAMRSQVLDFFQDYLRLITDRSG